MRDDDDLRPEYDLHKLSVVKRGPGRKEPASLKTPPEKPPRPPRPFPG
jgi:hypothetical protein